MELSIVSPGPVVADHEAAVRDLFDNQPQFQQFQFY